MWQRFASIIASAGRSSRGIESRRADLIRRLDGMLKSPGNAGAFCIAVAVGRLTRFRAKACPGLDPGWTPVRVKKTRENKTVEPGSDSSRDQKALAAAAQASQLGSDGDVVLTGLIDPCRAIAGDRRWGCNARGPDSRGARSPRRRLVVVAGELRGGVRHRVAVARLGGRGLSQRAERAEDDSQSHFNSPACRRRSWRHIRRRSARPRSATSGPLYGSSRRSSAEV